MCLAAVARQNNNRRKIFSVSVVSREKGQESGEAAMHIVTFQVPGIEDFLKKNFPETGALASQ